MKVSVIVTTYNRPDALKKVITALLSQTRPPDEILVADDGSGPETRELITSFKSNPGPPLCHVWQEDEGFRLSRIRNKAVLKSKGDYLILLDGDCIPARFFVADHLALAEKGCFFQGKRVLVNRKLAPGFDFRDTASFAGLICQALFGSISNAHHIIRIPFFPSSRNRKMSGVRGCNMGFFKQDVEAVNGFNHEFTSWGREDSEFVARLFKYGIKRKENPFRAVCFHLWHRENKGICPEKNEELLKQALATDAWSCANGLKEL
ncbi:MAG: glycosyl transferase family 2 [Desulfobacterales bacterium RIFOXYA12_FULL_46_15]|nr:MAG: glycosyl transferase family 2 [Desulfobacterales bacterium RIFOXYA12_FULL_46_15]